MKTPRQREHDSDFRDMRRQAQAQDKKRSQAMPNTELDLAALEEKYADKTLLWSEVPPLIAALRESRAEVWRLKSNEVVAPTVLPQALLVASHEQTRLLGEAVVSLGSMNKKLSEVLEILTLDPNVVDPVGE